MFVKILGIVSDSAVLVVLGLIVNPVFNVVAMPKSDTAKFEEIHPFAKNKKAMKYYNMETWKKELSLAQNQKNLVRKFMETCCNRPLKTLPICNEVGKPVYIAEPGYCDIAIQVLNEISKCPIGCKLLRVLLSKYLAKSTIGKILFVKEIEGYRTFSFVQLEQLNFFVLPGKPEEEFEPGKYEKECHCVRYIDSQFIPVTFNLPLDCAFFHEMVHWMHAVDLEFNPEQREREYFRKLENFEPSKIMQEIIKRHTTDTKKIRELCCTLSGIDISEFWGKYIFKNSEEYRTMFGLVKEGEKFRYDTINEASYLYCKEGLIRISHIFQMSNIPSEIIGMIALYGDQIVWKHIIDRSNKTIFGKGQYEYSELE